MSFHAPTQLIHDLAAGVEPSDVLQTKHNVPKTLWDQLAKDPFFQRQVDAKRAELKRDGVTFRYKAALMAEDLLEDIFIGAKSTEVGFQGKLDTIKFLAKVGNLEPKEEKNVVAPTGFSITINLGGNKVTLGQTNTIDVTPTEIEELPELPAHLTALFPVEPLALDV